MNRLALLESEGERIDKRANAAKKRAAEIFYNKLVNEDKLKEKMRMESKEREELEQARARNFEMKDQQRRDIMQK